MIPDGIEEANDIFFLHGMDLLAFRFRQIAGIRRIDAEVSELQRLFKRPMENAVDVLYGLCRKPLLCHQPVIEDLDLERCKLHELDISQLRFDVVPDRPLVGIPGISRYRIRDILFKPDVEPLTHRRFQRLQVGPCVDLVSQFRNPLPDFLLCLSVNGSSNLFAGFGVIPRSDTSLPQSVGTFSDHAAAFRCAAVFAFQ